jgi:TCP-1/cpn60 chaperonin family
MFRKTVIHKQMVKELLNPRIMLLSGGIEFARTEQRIASLETLFEQEDKYTEVLIGKILKFQPDILLVGRSVSRNAQELLLQAGVVLVQHVKANLLNRISRQTGATVIGSSDHIMNHPFGDDAASVAKVLGKCRRFRLVAFRDNEVWTDLTVTKENSGIMESHAKSTSSKKSSSPTAQQQRSIQALLADTSLSNHDRQDALAAKRLGEDVIDGCEAVKAGLANRGVAHTYTLLEGCPKHLGCTVVLRGASKAALKQIKAVFRFLAMTAYNLRLETTYLQERGARLRPDFKVLPHHAFSSSLAVDYGKPADGRKVRPWNGGNAESSLPRMESGELSAFYHQAILMTSIWMTEKTQCCPAEVKGICYYSLQDVALGQFLRDSCFNLSLKCQNPNCKKSVLDHSLSFVHNDGLINITVRSIVEEDTFDCDNLTPAIAFAGRGNGGVFAATWSCERQRWQWLRR